MFKQKRSKKPFLVLLIIILAVAGGAAYWVWERVPSDPVDVADGFLANLAEGKGGRALNYVSRAFQARTDPQKVLALVRGLDIQNPPKIQWTNQQVESGRIQLTGVLHDSENAARPIQIIMILENDAWRVDQVNVNGGDHPQGDGPDSATKQVLESGAVPPEATLNKMATDTLLVFNRSVTGKDFTPLFEHISKAGRSRTSPEELKKAFASFIEHGVDIEAIRQTTPEFDPAPAIDRNGRLLLKGMYPTKPARVFFNLEYVFEDNEWQLIGIDVQIKR